jgi:hypothetical protein
MFNSDILEVVIGVVFVFVLVSIICSAVREGIETWMKSRAAYLEHGIRELLRDAGGEGLAASFYEHPLINGLYPGYYAPPGDAAKADRPGDTRADGEEGGAATRREAVSTREPPLLVRGRNLPSYIPSRNFALALMDLAARGPVSEFNSGPAAAEVTPQTIRANIQNIRSPAVQRVLLTALDTGQGDLERVRQELERWYDSGMDRVSGWYRRSTQWMLFWIGLVVAVGLNINALEIGDYLYRHPAVREAVVARAEAAAARAQQGDTLSYREARATLDSLALPMGWSDVEFAGRRLEGPATGNARAWLGWILWSIPGWLATAFAATLGAPFWFDVLNKVMVIRSTVKPREKSPEEGSEDRQPKRTARAAGEAGEAGAEPAAAVQPRPAGQQPAPAGGAPPDAQGPPDAPEPPDADSRLDGCDVEPGPATLDEDLPQAKGGVAR